MSKNIHSTALVSAGAEIGDNVTIGAYSIIGPKVVIGDGTTIGPHVVIEGNTQIGKENTVSQFASIGSPPQDLKYKGENSRLIIGDKNLIREYVTLQPGTKTGRMATKIGTGNLFMCSSHVAHDCIVGDNNIFANSTALAGHVTIGNRVVIGGMVGIHQRVVIGDMVMLSGGALVRNDIPPYCTAHGDRAALVGLNRIGLERAGITPEQIAALKRLYRRLFYSGERITVLVKELIAEYEKSGKTDDRGASDRGDQLCLTFLRFIAESKHGIAQPRKKIFQSESDPEDN